MNLNHVVAVIVSWDQQVFHFINHTMFNPWLADVMFNLAQDHLILLVLAVTGLLYLRLGGWQRALAIGTWGAVAILFSNLLNNQLLKFMFRRARPFMAMPDVHLCAPLGNLDMLSLSFPSTHASSAAALAWVMVHYDSRLLWPACLFALAIGWGSIYTGGHYPFDVLAGYVVGICLGWFVVQLGRLSWPRE